MADVFGEIRSLLAKKHLPLEMYTQFQGIPRDQLYSSAHFKEKLLGWWWGQADDPSEVESYLKEQAALHHLSFRHILYGKEVADLRFKVEHFDWRIEDTPEYGILKYASLAWQVALLNGLHVETRIDEGRPLFLGGHLTDDNLTRILQAWLMEESSGSLLAYGNWIKQGHKPSYFDLPDREAVREATSWKDLYRHTANFKTHTKECILIGSTFWRYATYDNAWHGESMSLKTPCVDDLEGLKTAVEAVYKEADRCTFARYASPLWQQASEET